ncbi:protein of unknown function [Pseudodesulfovibrio profundus]|uniref:Uncharacterized protein n=1 Tax=Pseudodesulfovibrio profundus TaxID=57320 RepID=A0A2C8FDF1_9BACT|nr:ATP-binding protein [Pseudodesulfovibrio profundus]SOB60485.1 protein of unknown function [Pseudodesulfovibrio profundus]
MVEAFLINIASSFVYDAIRRGNDKYLINKAVDETIVHFKDRVELQRNGFLNWLESDEVLSQLRLCCNENVKLDTEKLALLFLANADFYLEDKNQSYQCARDVVEFFLDSLVRLLLRAKDGNYRLDRRFSNLLNRYRDEQAEKLDDIGSSLQEIQKLIHVALSPARSERIAVDEERVATGPVIKDFYAPTRLETFVGRDDVIGQMQKAWSSGSVNTIIVHGWGGFGKSSVLVEFYSQMRERGCWGSAQDVVVWYSFQIDDTFEDSFLPYLLKALPGGDSILKSSSDRVDLQCEFIIDYMKRNNLILFLDQVESLLLASGEASRTFASFLRGICAFPRNSDHRLKWNLRP